MYFDSLYNAGYEVNPSTQHNYEVSEWCQRETEEKNILLTILAHAISKRCIMVLRFIFSAYKNYKVVCQDFIDNKLTIGHNGSNK